jgi:Flp pilus assembly protein TadG
VNARTALRAVRASETGSALAEMAVIAPLLFLILIGLVEAGRFASYSIMAANAARAGVQYGSQNLVTADDSSGMEAAALSDAQNAAELSATATQFCRCADGTSSTCQPTDCAASHRLVFVQVTTTGDVPSLFRFPGLPASQHVSGLAVMRVAQ